MSLISENQIRLDCRVKSKAEVIDLFVDLMYESDKIKDKGLLKEEIYKREDIANTAIGDEIAIPHALSSEVTEAGLIFLRLKNPINWGNSDKVKYVFGIAVPKENKNNQHLKILSTLARNLMNEKFKDELLNSKDTKECFEILNGIGV